MNFKRMLPVLLLGAMTAALAQIGPDDPDWHEEEAPPPPAFSVDKLVMFDGGTIGSSLSYGIDPATLSIGKADGVVRYVLVASGQGSAKNIMYEGIRCSSGEVKTYARFNDGKWRNTTNPEWRSVFAGSASRYAWRLARAGVCDNAAPSGTPAEIARRIKAGPDLKGGL
jgi:CNP1-like family